MKCPECGIPVPEMPEDSTYEEQLCNSCSWENIPCIACDRTDLPLHINGKCPECFTPEAA